MRIHSNILTIEQIVNAAELGTAHLYSFSEHKSRTAKFGFEVALTGSSPYSSQSKLVKAATWDEWGVFLDTLFTIDPDMVVGSSFKNAYYRNAIHFHEFTNYRFENSHGNLPEDTHAIHRWAYDMQLGHLTCSKCSADMVRV